MDDATAVQLRLIAEVREALSAANVDWWLFGGWAMDFHAGEVTRPHSDIEVFIRARDRERARAALLAAGFAGPWSLYPDEGEPFLKKGQEVGLTFLTHDVAAEIVVPGRWSDWPFPAGSFDGPPLRLGDVEARAVSLEGLFHMKENFAAQKHGAPLRPKDIADIDRLRALIARRQSRP